MKRCVIMMMVVVMVMAVVLSARADVMTFDYADCEDVLLHSGVTNWNWGGSVTLQVGFDERRGIMRWDLSALKNQYKSIDSAYIELNNVTASVGKTIEMHEIKAANIGWVEGTFTGAEASGDGVVTWDYAVDDTTAWAGSAGCKTSGTDYEAAVLDSVYINSGQPATNFQFDLPVTLVDGWITAGVNNPGVIFSPTTLGAGGVTAGSSENATVANRPTLVVTYTPVVTETMTFDYTDCEDVGLNDGVPRYNYGGAATLQVGWDERVAIMRWDLSALKNQYRSILLAYIDWNVTTYSQTKIVYMHEIKAANIGWVEGTSTGAEASGDGVVTWDYAVDDTMAWAGSAGCKKSGTDYEATVLDSADISAATNFQFDLPATLVESWITAGANNPGVVFRPTTLSWGGITFATSEHATEADRPTLVVIYTPPLTGTMVIIR